MSDTPEDRPLKMSDAEFYAAEHVEYTSGRKGWFRGGFSVGPDGTKEWHSADRQHRDGDKADE